jgi:hypothetical protein
MINIPFLSSSAAKQTVRAVAAMRRIVVTIFMFIERMILLMNETVVESETYLFEVKIVKVIHTCFILW